MESVANRTKWEFNPVKGTFRAYLPKDFLFALFNPKQIEKSLTADNHTERNPVPANNERGNFIAPEWNKNIEIRLNLPTEIAPQFKENFILLSFQQSGKGQGKIYIRLPNYVCCDQSEDDLHLVTLSLSSRRGERTFGPVDAAPTKGFATLSISWDNREPVYGMALDLLSVPSKFLKEIGIR